MPSFLSRKKVAGQNSGPSTAPPSAIPTSISAPTGFTHVAHFGHIAPQQGPSYGPIRSTNSSNLGLISQTEPLAYISNDLYPTSSLKDDPYSPQRVAAAYRDWVGQASTVRSVHDSSLNHSPPLPPLPPSYHDGAAHSTYVPTSSRRMSTQQSSYAPTSSRRMSSHASAYVSTSSHRMSSKSAQERLMGDTIPHDEPKRTPSYTGTQTHRHGRNSDSASFDSSHSSVVSNVLTTGVNQRSSSGGTTASSVMHLEKRAEEPDREGRWSDEAVSTAIIDHPPGSVTPNAGSLGNLSIRSPTASTTSSFRKTASRYALSDFTFMRTLGTGSFGRVHLVRSFHNSRYYAIKALAKEKVVRMKQVEHTNSERDMLECVRHPFLVNLWGTFKDSAYLFMVMDFVSGGELFSLLRKSQRFPDPVAKFFAAEVALALDYLHSLDIIYRDLKPENILLAADGHVRVTDFGFARYCPDVTWTLCGTPDYLAPEIVQSRAYGKSVDWYAFGVLIYEMLAGYPPFFTEDSNPMKLYEKIIAGKVRYPSHFNHLAKDLIKCLLTSDLTKRYGNLANGSKDIFGNSWFSEVDWERLYKKEIPAPYVPHVENDGDPRHFDSYTEVDVESEYGQTGVDPYGHMFPLF